MSEFANNRNTGLDGADMPRLHPDAVRSWRNEMSAGINEYLGELRNIEAALQSHTVPSEATAVANRFRSREPVNEPPPRPTPFAEPPKAAATAPTSGSSEEQEFDARLANLKKMLAEKLTNAEGSDA